MQHGAIGECLLPLELKAVPALFQHPRSFRYTGCLFCVGAYHDGCVVCRKEGMGF